MSTTIIGLGYKARQGKDTVAGVWKKLLLDRVKCYSYARLMKEYCRDNHQALYARWRAEHPIAPEPDPKSDPIYGYTPILQWYGTDIVRNQDVDHWVNIVRRQIRTDRPEFAVITDVRFPNEAEYVGGAGGFLVQVQRMNEDGSQYHDPGRDPNHASETALDGFTDWDYVIRAKSGDIAGVQDGAFFTLRQIISRIPDFTYL